MRGLRNLALALGVAAALGAGPAGAAPQSYSGLVIFGDSLSDYDNAAALARLLGLPYPEQYPLGKASDGPLWSERVEADFQAAGLPVQNYAVVTAQVLPTGGFPVNLGAQIARFQLRNPAPVPADTLAVAWLGGNDMLNAIRRFAPDRPTGAEVVGLIVNAAVSANVLVNSVAGLAAKGIEDFLFIELPDLALIPRFSRDLPQLANVARFASGVFNAALRNAVAQLPAELSARTYSLDSAILAALADPAAVGVTNPDVPCVTPNPGGTPAWLFCEDPASHFFYDDIHPSSTLHALLAEDLRSAFGPAFATSRVADGPRVATLSALSPEAAARAVPAPVPLPAAGGLLLVGLAGLGALARRRRAGTAGG